MCAIKDTNTHCDPPHTAGDPSVADTVMASPNYQPLPRSFHNSALVDNKVVVCSGETQGGSEQSRYTVEVFCPHREQWEAKQCAGKLPAPGLRRAASAVVNDYLYLYGGDDGKGNFADSLHRLCTRTCTWTRLSASGKSPMPKTSAAMVACGNDLAVFGGLGAPNDFQRKHTQPGSSFVEKPYGATTPLGWTNEFHIYHLNEGMHTCICHND